MSISLIEAIEHRQSLIPIPLIEGTEIISGILIEKRDASLVLFNSHFQLFGGSIRVIAISHLREPAERCGGSGNEKPHQVHNPHRGQRGA
jgi:hypothetical protein